MIVYDSKNNRLAVFKKQASPEFWDAQWRDEELIKRISSGKTYHFIRKITTKYLPRGARVLEGGCGTGQVVHCLERWGYEAYGVDFAADTIRTVTRLFPKLRLSVQDVRQLNFEDNFFDGYWSLGVIEHFWDGYASILKEAHRVLKPGGYLFLTFPWMSPLRKARARRCAYPRLESTMDSEQFYEFVFDEKEIMRDITAEGFDCLDALPYDALKGLKDEINLFRAPLRRLYKSRSFAAGALRHAFTLAFARLTGHAILLVCKKR